MKTPPQDSLEEIFAIFHEERGDPYSCKVNFPRDSGQYEKPPFWWEFSAQLVVFFNTRVTGQTLGRQ
jgi:hypothetical protein